MLILILAFALQEERPDALLEALERKARSVQTCQAEIDLTRIPGATRIKIAFDRPGRRMYVALLQGPEASEHYLMEGWKLHRWRKDSSCSITNMTPYVDSMERGLKDVFTKLGVGQEERWGFSLGINLEGKPSKDERGYFRFYGCLSRSPYHWLDLLREETSLKVSREDKSIVFKMPERRKTVTVEGESGFLRSIETVDYDGTVRTAVCRSVVFDAPLPAFPTPPKGRERPPTREEIDEMLAGRSHVFKDVVATVIRNWDDVVKAGRTPAIGEAFRREFEVMASIWYEVRLHQVAAHWIRQKLDSGMAWKTLQAGAEAEVEQFLKTMDAIREEDRKFMNGQLEEFVRGLEGLFRDNAAKGTDPSEFRKMLRSALDVDSMLRDPLKSFDKRPGNIFKEELENAREL